MSLKAQALLLLIVAVGCQCKPFSWGAVVKNEGKIEINKKVEAGAEVGVENWRPGVKANVHGEGDLNVEDKLTGMIYVAKKSADGKGMTGIGLYHNMDAKAGLGVAADAGINTAGGKGKSLLSATGGNAESTGLTHKETLSVIGDTHMMSNDELGYLANLYGGNMRTGPLFEHTSGTTERFFSG